MSKEKQLNREFPNQILFICSTYTVIVLEKKEEKRMRKCRKKKQTQDERKKRWTIKQNEKNIIHFRFVGCIYGYKRHRLAGMYASEYAHIIIRHKKKKK